MLPVVFNRFNCLSNRAHGGSLGASADQTAHPSFSSLKGQTEAKLFGALLVVFDACLFASFRSSLFDVVFYLLSEPLGVDFDVPSRPSDLQKL